LQTLETRLKSKIYRFPASLAIAVGLALLFALFILVRFHGETRFFYLYYMVPIAVPFIAFGLDRLEFFNQTTLAQRILDVCILTLAILRNFVEIPFISGHALFLTYALFSARTKLAKITAALVLVIVVLMKWYNWHDFYTPTGGFILGAVAAYLYRLFRQKSQKMDRVEPESR
jgi:hypothetical protein